MSQITLSSRLLRKIQTQMRIIYITEKKPKKKIVLDPIDPQDINVNLQNVIEWSQQNKDLYDLILQNGMAQFICNKEFLFEFYNSLNFNQQGIEYIDIQTLNLTNLQTLNLTQNKIKIIQNIPQNLKVLYLDHNIVSQINLRVQTSLQMLSLSHNQINDKIFTKIAKFMPHLRCLNIAYNLVQNIELFVQNLKKLDKLKILISLGNPISLLNIYWKYVTENKELLYFENQKYVKPEPIVIKKKVQPPKVQQKKQDKKDIKKDIKKGAKVQQKVIQQPPVQIEQPVKEIPIQINQQNSKFLNILISVSSFDQNQSSINGLILDSSLIPEGTQSNKTQTKYWLEGNLMNEKINTYQNRIAFDSATIEDGQWRINFQLNIQKKIALNLQNLQSFEKGLVLNLWKQQPKMKADADSGQSKPQLQEGQIKLTKQIIGSLFIDTRKFYKLKNKEISYKYRLFSCQAVDQALFKNPFHNEMELIGRNLQKFEGQLKKIQQQKQKKLQQQQAAKASKKSGKDAKKPPVDKKAAKKDAKQPVANEKKKVQKSKYSLNQVQYRYLGEGKMYKGSKQFLSVSMKIM